jgi:8-oxo-dGTP pyrophosphatase MutT (NUDIX family)
MSRVAPNNDLSPGRVALLDMLERHQPYDEHEREMRERIAWFVAAHPDCFERTLLEGHVTASAWVVDRSREKALLTHHAKLGRWLQLGGHCDGESDVLRVALREVSEESGLHNLTVLHKSGIYDVDAHDIPARAEEPAHVHYDIRFAFEADPRAPLRITPESKDLQWVDLYSIRSWNPDLSVLRLAAKTRLLISAALGGVH